jgi:hypothetical protein
VAPAIEASGTRSRTCRSCFASYALAAGTGIHASPGSWAGREMIERHCGTLLDGAVEAIATLLDALDRGRGD